MPRYEYQAVDTSEGCEFCRERFEVRQGMQDPPVANCPRCGAAVKRLISVCAVCSSMSERAMLSDRNLREKGFSKFVNEGDGRFRRVV